MGASRGKKTGKEQRESSYEAILFCSLIFCSVVSCSAMNCLDVYSLRLESIIEKDDVINGLREMAN